MIINRMRPIVVIAGATCSVASLAMAAPVPKEKPVLTCEFRILKDTAIIGGLDRIGEVLIENTSNTTVEIPYITNPDHHLELQFFTISKQMYVFKPSDLHSIAISRVLTLKPGETYKFRLPSFVATRSMNLLPGKYKVKAAYDFQGRKYESNEVEITLTDK